MWQGIRQVIETETTTQNNKKNVQATMGGLGLFDTGNGYWIPQVVVVSLGRDDARKQTRIHEWLLQCEL